MIIPVNYLAVLVAAIASFVFGFLVHGPVFGKTWMSLMKITPKDMEAGKKEMEKKMPLYMLVALLQQFVMAFVLAHLAYIWDVHDVVSALTLAFWMWLGFIATVLLNGVLWEKRTVSLYAFNVAYHLGNVIIATLIVGLWR